MIHFYPSNIPCYFTGYSLGSPLKNNNSELTLHLNMILFIHIDFLIIQPTYALLEGRKWYQVCPSHSQKFASIFPKWTSHPVWYNVLKYVFFGSYTVVNSVTLKNE